MGKLHHIGLQLNLENATDVEISNILNNLPSYTNKSKFIRKAIIFYHRYGDNVPSVEEPGVKEGSGFGELTEVLKNLSRTVSDMQGEINSLKADIPKDAPMETPKEERKKAKPEKKVEPVKKEEPPAPAKEEVSENDIAIDKDTKNTHISYDDFMGDFFKE